MLARAAAVGLGVMLGILPVLAGAAGYYVGSARAPLPSWTDREFDTLRLSPESVGIVLIVSTMRCTYHLSDGSVRRVETPEFLRVTVGVPNTAGDARVCPLSP